MASNDPIPESTTRVILGGDVMLGRMVREAVLLHGAGYPLGGVAAILRAPDLTIVNLECAITACPDRWRGAPKAFYFGAPPQAIASLTGAGVDMVSLANNHTLDFGAVGLHETLHHLRESGIRYAGAGANLAEALSPVILDRGGMRFGMAAFCDHQADFAARQDSPGIAYLDLDDEAAALAAWSAALGNLQRAAADWPILSLHWGPNMAFRPSKKFRRLAHAAIDMGWKILFGHSAHVFQGIEIYRGCPIMYAAGDLVDDYYVDPDFRNDHQLLFEMELTRDALRQMLLYPVFIGDCRVCPAGARQVDYISAQMTELCNEMGTRVQRENGRLRIECVA